MLLVNDEMSIPLSELRMTFSRSGGPGGQNVNKLNTKVTMHWDLGKTKSLPEAVRDRFFIKYARRINQLGEIVLTSQRFRDQGRNITDCHDKLRTMILSVAKPPKRRKPTRPSKASKERRLKAKQLKSARKQMRKSPNRYD